MFPALNPSSIIRPIALSGTAALLAMVWNPGAARAAILVDEIGVVEQVGAPAAEVDPLATACGFTIDVPFQASPLGTTTIAQSAKSSAILGGQPSALDLIRLAQEQEGATLGTSQDTLATAADPAVQSALAPAAGGERLAPDACLSERFVPPVPTFGSEDFLASRRLEIGRTTFDRDWQRVSAERISMSRYRRSVGRISGDPMSTMASVNRWVNRSIAFTEDRDLFSRADFWAGAGVTLRLRRGDCEDIALTKMQLLATAGIPREDMILTIARDLVRNADHAVLIVHHEGHYYMLDNASDELFDASLSHDYRAILSFGVNQTWLHGA